MQLNILLQNCNKLQQLSLSREPEVLQVTSESLINAKQ